MDITLKVLVNPNTSQMTNDRDMIRQRRGDIMSVYLASKVSTLQPNGDYLLTSGNLNPLMTYIHVTGIPSAIGDEERLIALRERFTSPITRLNDEQPDADIGLFHFSAIRHRQWRILFSTFTTPVRNALRNGGERTFTWAEFKTHIKRRDVTNHLSRTSDAEIQSMADGDVG